MARLSQRLLWPAILFGAAPLLLGASVEKDLQGIRSKIAKEKQGISRVQKEEGSLLNSLGKIETELERRNVELTRTARNVASVGAELEQTQAKADALEASIERHRELFKDRAVALYRWHRSGNPLVIFGGDAPVAKLLQRKRYLETALSFDRELVTKLSGEARAEQDIQAKLARQKQELDDQRRKLADARESVRKEAEKKKQLLASVRKEKEGRERALKELEQAALRLQKMLEELARRSAEKSAPPSGAGLGARFGKLDWPARGALLSGFGKARHREFATEVFRNGIDIGAPSGQEVKAVESGTVAFADRFSGYGKMMIVDHGERYYSIYAHLAELLKNKGERVSRGETLGLVGDTDSLAGAKLYFELRKDGRSIDPVPWFKK